MRSVPSRGSVGSAAAGRPSTIEVAPTLPRFGTDLIATRHVQLASMFEF